MDAYSILAKNADPSTKSSADQSHKLRALLNFSLLHARKPESRGQFDAMLLEETWSPRTLRAFESETGHGGLPINASTSHPWHLQELEKAFSARIDALETDLSAAGYVAAELAETVAAATAALELATTGQQEV